MTTARYRPTWDLVLDPLVSCKLCLGEYPVEQMTTIAQCQCIFCTLCLKQYVELLIKEGLETAISCPDAACPKRGHLQENEIECMVASEIMQRYKKLQFEREVLLDPCRTWCPSSTCQAVCQLQESSPQDPQLVQCKACDIEFCSACKSNWHPGQGCQENMPISFLPGETSSVFKMEEDDAPIKRCPKCKVYIERDEGCAQMMCKNCKHAFCWYCLESLDVSKCSTLGFRSLEFCGFAIQLSHQLILGFVYSILFGLCDLSIFTYMSQKIIVIKQNFVKTFCFQFLHSIYHDVLFCFFFFFFFK
uniref:RBR-type E3 ubiquitin transferase n=1 Tax=Anas zonorhyncha TaxID=75864 RepID=A0A8B9VN12_9AVES